MIDKQTLLKVAEIARLKLEEKELEELQKDLNTILKHFEKINEIEARGEELYYIKQAQNVVRKDSSKPSEGKELIKKQFTKRDGNHLLAPKSL